MFITKSFKLCLFIFIVINILLYLFILFFNHLVPFNTYYYSAHAYHYLQDPRYHDQNFDFLQALGQYDAQWYLHIASIGYSKGYGPFIYAFFPLYPITLFITNKVINNIELTAFIVSNILLLIDFISLYFIVTKLYNEKIAFRTSLLIFLFPFSIFYRSYFTEGLFLLLLLWFCYFITIKKWFFATVFLAFLCVTRPTGLFLVPLYAFLLLKAVTENKSNMSLLKMFTYCLIALIPFCGWLYFCLYTTGDMYYWTQASKGGMSDHSMWPIAYNIQQLIHFNSLPFHNFYGSKVENIMLLLVIAIIIFSRKHLKPELWWTSFLLAIPIIFIRDLMSFSRYESISFPLFLYLAQAFNGKKFIVIYSIFFFLFFLTSLFFVNWYWVG